MFTSMITKGLTVFLTKLLTSLATEKVISYTFFKVAEAVAKSTKTTADDEWVAKVKASYEEL